MKSDSLLCVIACFIAVAICSNCSAAKVALDENGVADVDGKKIFVLSFSIPPPPGGKTPDGTDGYAELAEGGVNFFRIAPKKGQKHGSPEALDYIQSCLDTAAAHHQLCWITLGPIPKFKTENDANARLLRSIIERFKDHPGLGAWKGYDEPAWTKQPADQVLNAYRMFHALDPNHPVIIIHAPTLASKPLEDYMPACDITGVDIYPVAYPPVRHSDFPNHEISVVADCTKWVAAAGQGKPVWMTLQVAWGGTATPGKVLRYPTFAQQRYMAYAAIINGARGLNYQGPALPLTLNKTDAPLGWNWTYWHKVMRALFVEFREDSPLFPALVAANSKMPIKSSGADGVEFCARQADGNLYLIASKREGEAKWVHFSGLDVPDGTGEVLFEEPRTVKVKGGAFDDPFGPEDVHVYRFRK